jgi:hypothetical protein
LLPGAEVSADIFDSVRTAGLSYLVSLSLVFLSWRWLNNWPKSSAEDLMSDEAFRAHTTGSGARKTHKDTDNFLCSR